MGLRETFGLARLNDEERAAWAEQQAALRKRQAEYWSWVGRVAVGVFLGNLAFAAIAAVVFYAWLDNL